MTLPTDINIAPYVTRESHHMPSARTAARSVCCRLSMLHGPPPRFSLLTHPTSRQNHIPTSTAAPKYTTIHGGTPNSIIKIKYKYNFGAHYTPHSFFSGPGAKPHTPNYSPTHFPSPIPHLRLSTYFPPSFFTSNQTA